MVAVLEAEEPSLTCKEAVRSCSSPTSSFVAKSITCMMAKEGSADAGRAERTGVAMVREQSKDTVAMVVW